jgi:hypothetical protein
LRRLIPKLSIPFSLSSITLNAVDISKQPKREENQREGSDDPKNQGISRNKLLYHIRHAVQTPLYVCMPREIGKTSEDARRGKRCRTG